MLAGARPAHPVRRHGPVRAGTRGWPGGDAILHRAPQRGHPTWAMNDEADFRAGLPWCRAHRGLLAGYRAGAARGRAVPHRLLVATRGLHRGPLPRARPRRTPIVVDCHALGAALAPNALRTPTGLPPSNS